MIITNNALLFTYLSYLVCTFLAPGYFFVRFIIANNSDDALREQRGKVCRANAIFTIVSALLLLSYLYNYIIISLPLLWLLLQI